MIDIPNVIVIGIDTGSTQTDFGRIWDFGVVFCSASFFLYGGDISALFGITLACVFVCASGQRLVENQSLMESTWNSG